MAELVSRSGQSPPWAVVIEVEARRRARMPERVLEYLSRVWRKLRHGPRRRDRYQVMAVLVYLTGRKKDLIIDMRLPGTSVLSIFD